MQPPPRKGQFIKVCKNLHSEQLSKLQAKNQQECDLLEDIRNFTKQRSAIEKSYGEALCKISSTYQNRKIACVPDIRLEDGSDAWNIYSVWRTVLDETEKLGKARLAAVEVFHQRISEDAKHTRQIKINLQKKLSENLITIQKELQTQVQDLDRTKKLYYDEENVAYDAREKASAAEEKLKRKKGSLFQSISSLQKNSAKFTAKKELCDEKSAGARNDYLLTLASTNAHQKRYYEVDFERILRTMENDMYEKVAEYFTLISRTELLTCTATQNSYSVIKEQASTITRGYNLRCYLTFYPMLGKNIEYDFEPCKGDKISKISIHDENSKEQLNLESGRCVSRILKEAKTIREATKKINKLLSSQKPDGELPPEVESKIEEIRQIIRRCETSKAKAEARVEILKEGGVDVEDYSKALEEEIIEENAEMPLSRSGSSLSVKEEVEYREPEIDGEIVSASDKQFSVESVETDKDQNENPPQDQQAPKSLEPSWDPLSVTEWGDEPVSPLPPVTNGPPPEEITYPKCIVQYNYTAQNVDELTIIENEELEVISEGDGDGWIQARNYKGEVGYIPQNYVETEDGSTVAPLQSTLVSEYSEDTTITEAYGTSSGYDKQYNAAQADGEELEAPVSFSSIDYSFETGDDITETVTETEGGTYSYEPSSEPPSELPPPPPPTIITDGPMKQSIPSIDIPQSESETWGLTSYCRAIYDYEATCPEELTFDEGQIIKILRKNIHDVDDGWWEGEINDMMGLFPSLVVEECRSDGEPFTPDAASLTSPCTTPPPHTPPEVPGFLLPPERVIITQPTPDVETVEEAMELHKKDQDNLEKEIVGEQQQQYQRQFSSSPDSETATEKEHQYAELISSPDQSNQEEDAKNREVCENFPSPPPPSLPLTQITRANIKEDRDSTLAESEIIEKEEEEDRSSEMFSEEKESETFTSSDVNISKGLNVAQIIVTAASPMKESQENEDVTAPIEDSRAEADQATEDDGQAESEDTEGESNFLDDDRPPPPPPAPEGGGGSGVEETREEYDSELSNNSLSFPKDSVPTVLLSKVETKNKVGDNTSMETNTPTPKSPTPSEGPPDLDPEKLKTLEKIKESIA